MASGLETGPTDFWEASKRHVAHNGIGALPDKVLAVQKLTWQKLIQVGTECLQALLSRPSAVVPCANQVYKQVRVLRAGHFRSCHHGAPAGLHRRCLLS